MILVDEIKVWTTKRPFHRGSCHLASDTNDVEELHAFAKRIGMKREWFQPHPTCPHYDLTPARREKALELGAVFVPAREQARTRIRLREAMANLARAEGGRR